VYEVSNVNCRHVAGLCTGLHEILNVNYRHVAGSSFNGLSDHGVYCK